MNAQPQVFIPFSSPVGVQLTQFSPSTVFHEIEVLTIDDKNMLWLKIATQPHLILFNKNIMSQLENKDLNLLLFQELKMFCSCRFLT